MKVMIGLLLIYLLIFVVASNLADYALSNALKLLAFVGMTLGGPLAIALFNKRRGPQTIGKILLFLAGVGIISTSF